METQKNRVRFAPSPTGYLHIGSARTALFNWLFARHYNGTFVLRIEDTDKKRNTPEALAAIMEGLEWLGIEPDEGPGKDGGHGPYFQSRRDHIYKKYIEELKQSNSIYPCFCTKERIARLREEKKHNSDGAWGYDGHCRSMSREEAQKRIESGESHTWRLKVSRPGKSGFTDLILGLNEVDHEDIEDIVLIRPDGSPTYNLAVVIDDHDMEISHVIRGQDHLTNTFKQILIYTSLGWELPKFAHISLILAPPPNKGKLSKRHGGAEIKEYIARGYLPEAVVNWLALIGWSYGEGKEILSREELIENFDMTHASKSHARLNPSKLDAISGHRIRELPREELKEFITPYLIKANCLNTDQPDLDDKLEIICDFASKRLSCFSETPGLIEWAYGEISYEKKAKKVLRKTKGAPVFLAGYAKIFPKDLPDIEKLEEQARNFVSAEKIEFGTFAKAVRAAITGRMTTPPLFHCMYLLGSDETIKRLRKGSEYAAKLQAV